MVDTERGNNCDAMGALAFGKRKLNGSTATSPFSKKMEMGSKVYKLSINIEKIRPKPCPKSKKSACLTRAMRYEQARAGFKSSTDDPPSIPSRKTAACNICKQVLQSAQSLYLHKKKQHCRICDVCHVECATKVDCQIHRKLHETNDPDLPYKCHVCAEKFDTKIRTRVHVRTSHADSKTVDYHARESGEKMFEKLMKNDGRSRGVVFTCKVCSEQFTNVEAAEAHAMDHMEIVDEEHKCSICKKLFVSETSLNDHLAEHLSRALRCPICPKVFINRATLRIHMKSHGHG